MSEQPLIERLQHIMPPHEGAGDVVDWQAAENSWGVAFPADYKEFVAVYGAGEVDAFLTFLIPGLIDAPIPSDGMVEETRHARQMWREYPSERSVPGDAVPPVIAWGVNARSDLLCWVTTERDPSDWPVAVWSRGNLGWHFYACGMIEYVLRLFEGEFDDMWRTAGGFRRFVHVREARRLWVAGISPDTGEPNPYADMFGPPPWLSGSG
ncbi:SMI1/KNR4 family protein [Actinacidiphila glaucinigra]|uniref:SMI1/KNR4 family protein n=1 Tax=Actinacidiphila glaucinigra TaxID=235986 RepID=UPI00386DC2F8